MSFHYKEKPFKNHCYCLIKAAELKRGRRENLQWWMARVLILHITHTLHQLESIVHMNLFIKICLEITHLHTHTHIYIRSIR